MLTHFPQAVPEIPVSSVDKAAEYYVNVLGFSFDWGNDVGGIGGISQGDCRMFLTNAPFREMCRRFAPGLVYVNEMVMATPVVHGNAKTHRMITFGPDEHPRSLQLYGSDPAVMGQAVAILLTQKLIGAKQF